MAQNPSNFFFDILPKLSAEELIEIKEFSLTPHLKCKKNCKAIFETIAKNSKKGEGKYLEKNWLKRAAVGNISPIYFTKAVKEAAEVIRQFLIHKQLTANPNQASILLLNALTDYGLDEEMGVHLARTKANQDAASTKNINFYAQKFAYENIQRKYLSMQSAKGVSINHNFEETMDAVTQFHLLAKLKFAIFLLHWNGVTGKSTSQNLIEELLFLSKIHQNLIHQNPALQIYFELFNLWLPNNQKKDVTILLNLLKENETILAIEEIQEIYILIDQLLIRKINKEKLNLTELKQVYNELFFVFQYLVKHDLLREGQYIPYERFKNVLVTPLHVNTRESINWGEHFLNKEIAKVHPADQYEVQQINKAILFFYTKQYQQALKILAANSPRIDNFYYLDNWSLKLRCHFELEHDKDYLPSKYIDYKQQIKYIKKVIANKPNLSAHNKLAYHNFFDAFKKLIVLCDIPNAIPKKKLEKFQLEVENQVPITSKKWLLEKIDNLK